MGICEHHCGDEAQVRLAYQIKTPACKQLRDTMATVWVDTMATALVEAPNGFVQAVSVVVVYRISDLIMFQIFCDGMGPCLYC